ncbi:MAG: SGNH/GDSL hydrolase family protein, partial [Isosphaeraceae bacterium]
MRFARSLFLVLLILPRFTRADGPFHLKDGETVLFLGDSITQAGRYVVDVEAFLLTRFPDRSFTIVNHGISSETVSGTSEPDHDPRRPDAHNRFTRDVTAWSPDVLVACFGMNDGNYFPFEADRFARYQAGVNRLLDRARDEARVKRVTLLTPPPFDPYRRRASDAEATTYGYKFASIDYDQTLGRYSDWLLTLPRDRPGLLVVDVHSALNAHLAERRKRKVSYFLAGDAVHPNPTGHWLMAQALLLAWNAPAVVAEATVSASERKALSGEVRDVSAEEDEGLTFTWRSPLPLPVDPACDPASLALERVGERLNRY